MEQEKKRKLSNLFLFALENNLQAEDCTIPISDLLENKKDCKIVTVLSSPAKGTFSRDFFVSGFFQDSSSHNPISVFSNV
jgi:hypothetical protein